MHRRRIPTAHTFARTRSRPRRILCGGPSRAHGESHDHTQVAQKIPRSHSHLRDAPIRTSSRWPPARRERLDLTSSLGPPTRLTPDFTSAECKAFLPLESIPAISSSCAARFLQFGYTATLIIGGVSLTSPSVLLTWKVLFFEQDCQTGQDCRVRNRFVLRNRSSLPVWLRQSGRAVIHAHIDAHAWGFIVGNIVTPTRGRPARSLPGPISL
jgi:hypothetical protein